MTLEKIMKHHTEGGRMIRHYNGKKEYILSEDDMNFILGLVNNLDIPNVIYWLAITEELPEHGETVLTYTPTTEMAEEQIRLIKYGSLKSGFPAGITHWKYLDKPTCV